MNVKRVLVIRALGSRSMSEFGSSTMQLTVCALLFGLFFRVFALSYMWDKDWFMIDSEPRDSWKTFFQQVSAPVGVGRPHFGEDPAPSTVLLFLYLCSTVKRPPPLFFPIILSPLPVLLLISSQLLREGTLKGVSRKPNQRYSPHSNSGIFDGGVDFIVATFPWVAYP